MCDLDRPGFQLIPLRPGAPAEPAHFRPDLSAESQEVREAPLGKRRIWDLDDHAHCPLIGVCMPIATLRRLLGKLPHQLIPLDDYELHCLVVGTSKSRNTLSELIQKELEKRYLLKIHELARLKDPALLMQRWTQALASHDVAATLWAVLTHPRCSTAMEKKVLGDIHMLQHQVGMANRVDQSHMEALLKENGVLGRELARAQQRTHQMAQEHAMAMAGREQETMRLRGDLIARQTEADRLRQELAELKASTPDLATRQALKQVNQSLQERVMALQKALSLAQQQPTQPPQRQSAPPAPIPYIGPPACNEPEPIQPPSWSDRAVLCVGGRPNVIPIYREVIEGTGAQFIHHDGGLEESPTKLDATLAAADLVICQTGCISHDAYWRVKHHCKRTGKPCLFVETPSKSALQGAIQKLAYQL